MATTVFRRHETEVLPEEEWMFPDTITQPSDEASHAVHGISLFLIALSLFGSIFIIVYGIATRRYKTIGERFPLYTGGLAIMWSLVHSIDHSYMWIKHGETPGEQTCQALGALLGTFLMAEITMINIVAVSVYMTVYHSRTLSFGLYDWKLWAGSLGAGLAFAIVGSIIGAFGPDVHWCFLDIRSEMGRIYMLALSFPCTVALIVPATCHFLVYRKILQSERAVTRSRGVSGKDVSESAPTTNHNSTAILPPRYQSNGNMADGAAYGHSQRNKAIVGKLTDFILADVLTFSGCVAYTVGVGIFKREPVWLSIWVSMGINSSGWLNTAVFIRQLYRRHQSFNAQSANKMAISRSVSNFGMTGGVRSDAGPSGILQHDDDNHSSVHRRPSLPSNPPRLSNAIGGIGGMSTSSSLQVPLRAASTVSKPNSYGSSAIEPA
ncbi:hypothetical protein DFS34DRAFT_4594 [Phlyctochytrium arcticum]|nr:hypothetical protein DFS34DRAFT_4594 [Phlyctochytrium arcticum]